ncbi:hypothetical protein ACWEPL_43940 [Nonomuraea sp. NPDC004186]
MKIVRGLVAVTACLGLLAACSAGRPRVPSSADAPVRSVPGTTMASAGAGPTPTETVTPSTRWRSIPGAGLKGASALVDVLAKGPEDAWAAGFEAGAEDEDGVPVLVHWNGSVWTRIPVEDSELRVRAFDVAGPDDIWLVGSSPSGGGVSHWDGRVWATPRPFGVTDGYRPYDVATGKGRAVIVGSGPDGAFAIQWDGKRFRRMRSGTDGVFEAVALKDGHVWAVGRRAREDCQGTRPTVAHMSPDGRWSYNQDMSVPEVPGGRLESVLAITPTDVWAVGAIGGYDPEMYPPANCRPTSDGEEGAETPGSLPTPLVMHWNGSAWQRVELPPLKGALHGLTAFGKNNLWASGTDPRQPGVALLLHYDGTSWTSEGISAGGSGHAAIAAIPGTSDMWAVGSVGEDTDHEHAFVARRH